MQVSVMAMYENLASGVVLIVPSLSFYQAMARALLENGVGLHLVDLDLLEANLLGFTAIEWWAPYFSEVMIHFDSWHHLKDILSSSTDFQAHKQKVRDFMQVHTNIVLQQWSKLLWCDLHCSSLHNM